MKFALIIQTAETLEPGIGLFAGLRPGHASFLPSQNASLPVPNPKIVKRIFDSLMLSCVKARQVFQLLQAGRDCNPGIANAPRHCRMFQLHYRRYVNVNPLFLVVVAH
jgi:hypothetical protein